MQENTGSTIAVEALLFVARCVLPLLVMLGISYLLRRLGLLAEPPPAPLDQNDGNNSNGNHKTAGGGMAHGKA